MTFSFHFFSIINFNYLLQLLSENFFLIFEGEADTIENKYNAKISVYLLFIKFILIPLMEPSANI